jgi:hypothetical protein
MASRRGPLSKAETFYVTEHAKLGKEIQEIATDLDRPIKSIEKCYTKTQKENKEVFNVGSQMARHKGSVVMTENASTLSDSTRKVQVPTSAQNCVTKIK